jgi:hypothetical protein
MTITQKMLSNLSCAFTLTSPDYQARYHEESRSNHDWLEHSASLPFLMPALELPLNERSLTVQEAQEGFERLFRVMTPSKADMALAAKGERERLSLDCIDALATANRPDTIPSDLRIIRVTGWEPEKRVFIPLPAGKDAKLADLVKAATKPDGFMMNIPMRPIGEALGEVDATAWRKGEASSIRVHAPGSLPEYRHPQRELTEGERMAEAWLANPERIKKPATRSSRMARMAARFWDKGDGHQGLQPVMAENASQRALGRINRAIRFNAVAAE